MSEQEQIRHQELDHYQLAREAKFGDLSYISLDEVKIPRRLARKVLESYYFAELMRNRQSRLNIGMGAVKDPKEAATMMLGEKIGMFKMLNDLGMSEQEIAVSAKAYIDDQGGK